MVLILILRLILIIFLILILLLILISFKVQVSEPKPGGTKIHLKRLLLTKKSIPLTGVFWILQIPKRCSSIDPSRERRSMTEPKPPSENPADKPAQPIPPAPPSASEAIAAGVPKPSAPVASTAVTASAPKPPAAPPAKPAAKPAAKAGRRMFLLSIVGSWIAVAWVTLSSSAMGMLLGTVRFLFPNVLSEPPSTFKAGNVDSYEEGKVEDKYKEVGSWVILYRDDSNRRVIYALSTTCTHLGCTPNWLEADKKFKCPCHGSGFKITGVNFEGPAPRPLERYAIKKSDDGQIVVDKSRKFQKELGQWDDPGSYILV